MNDDDDNNNKRRNIVLAIVAIVIIILFLLMFLKGCPQKPEGGTPPDRQDQAAPPNALEGNGGAGEPDDEPAPGEVLTEATLAAPDRVPAGSAFTVEWTGPDNEGDFVGIVGADAGAHEAITYAETAGGASLELTAPIEPGTYELRYVTGRSRTILARRPIEVEPVGATLAATDEVILGRDFSVEWTGPDNQGDYITIVAVGARDEDYGSYVNTEKGSPVTLTAPTVAGEHELRYVAAQGRTVLARRPIRVVMADATLAAPEEAVAGTTIDVEWTGPDNSGDYITVVAREVPDGQYGNYKETAGGSPLRLLLPIMEGAAEIRYMTGQGHRVLARRAITINAAEVTLAAPETGAAGTHVSITWTGPDNPGDYITIVASGTPDGQYAAYANTSEGSPLTVQLPDEPGEAEIRYMAGQGNIVLARTPIRVTQ